MYLTPAQIKGKIKNLAKKNGTDPIALLRIYMMERFLERIRYSKYKDDFIIKGGILVTSMIGIAMRSTMDIDTTIRNFDLTKEETTKIISEIKDPLSFLKIRKKLMIFRIIKTPFTEM
ncbi:nucleotidyl transferase AbiEii/AbiGii toxin family protein [uncultured Catenibacterium sp.]|uniref:nucleotidyl transferase AbiEii/AbiGii toxin family protein n=1 Tax=uncultured Catenibacterium sp. TaxID=286142 RepID=UPI00262D187D|nr:nucleotidyl transferase AbiEii/AbiGii toxin family protein [uncultured Catenibacterium sp.]